MDTTELREQMVSYSEILDEADRLEEGRLYGLVYNENEGTTHFFGSRSRDKVRDILNDIPEDTNLRFRIISTRCFYGRVG